jgi:hypothetical protein
MKQTTFRRTIRKNMVIATCALSAAVAGTFHLRAADAAPDTKKDDKKTEAAASDSEETRNWIETTVGGNLVSGDRGAFQQRTGLPRDAFGGVTDFHYEKDVGKKGIFEVDGRGIFDAHNYQLELNLSDPDKGYVKAGFQEFSTYYDGNGEAGYFPRNGAVIKPTASLMEVDRTKTWFEGALTLENKPQVKFRYSYETRDGFKPSTTWGDTTATGIVAAPGNSGTRNFVPSYMSLDENRQNFAIDLSHTVKSTLFGVGGRFDLSKIDDARYEHKLPEKAIAGGNRWVTDKDVVKADLFSVHAFSETDFNEQFKLTTGYAYTTMDTDIGGSYAIGAAPNANPAAIGGFAGRQAFDHSIFGVVGGSQLEEHVGNINLMYRPTEHFTIVPSLRFDDQGLSGESAYRDIRIAGGGAATTTDFQNTSKRGFLNVTEGLDARYNGITNWVFYAHAELAEGDGNLEESEVGTSGGVVSAPILRDTDTDRLAQKYAVGANWYPLRNLNFGAQYYHKIVDDHYEHPVDNTTAAGNLYPAFIHDQKFNTDDLNFRVSYRPIATVTLVSRYDLTYQTIDSKMANVVLNPGGTLGPGVEGESANRINHIFSESLTWFPIPRLYLQASGSYTIDETRTGANDIIRSVEVSRNNYYTADASVGYALTEKTDVGAQYTFYLADDYNPAIAAFGLPLGAGLEEHLIGANFVHRFSKRLQLTGRYAFMTSHDKLSGGQNDFDAHILTTSLRYRF